MARIAHVGYGYWGRNVARNLAELGHLEAVVDADPRVAGEAAAALGCRALTFEAALRDPAVEGVSIAAPAVLHHGLAKAALLAGKHVMVEKPLALALGDAQELGALASDRRLTLMIGHLLRYHPAFERLRDLVRAGAIGRLKHVESRRMSLGKIRTEENVLWSFAPHDISMVLALVDAEPEQVAAHGSAFVTPGVADIANVAMRFAAGESADISVSWLHPFKEQVLVAVGDQGALVFRDSEPDWGRKLCLYRHRIDKTGAAPTPVKAEPEYLAVAQAEPLREECRHFAMCIDGGAQPLTDAAEGLRVLRVLDRAERRLAGRTAAENTSNDGGRNAP